MHIDIHTNLLPTHTHICIESEQKRVETLLSIIQIKITFGIIINPSCKFFLIRIYQQSQLNMDESPKNITKYNRFYFDLQSL